MHRVHRVSDFRLWDSGLPDQRFEQWVDRGLASPELVSAPTGESDQGVEHEQAWHLQGVLIDRAGERLYRFVGVDEPEVHADLRGDSGGEGVEGGDRRPLRASLLGGLPVEFPSRLVAGFHTFRTFSRCRANSQVDASSLAVVSRSATHASSPHP